MLKHFQPANGRASKCYNIVEKSVPPLPESLILELEVEERLFLKSRAGDAFPPWKRPVVQLVGPIPKWAARVEEEEDALVQWNPFVPPVCVNDV